MMRTRRKRAEAAATPTSKSKRREANLASYLHIQSLLGWDTQLKEYIENPNVLSKVKINVFKLYYFINTDVYQVYKAKIKLN